VTGGGPGGGPVLLVGYGNPLRTDDGAGPAVAERVAADPRAGRLGIDARTAHQLTPELAVDAASMSLLVLVDAAEGMAPGEIASRQVEPSGGADPAMTHHIEPESLLGLARWLFGAAPPAVIVSIGVRSLEVGEGLTPEVAAAVEQAAAIVVGIVEEHRGA
jgi:hydrogenase maturation protease